MHAIRVFCAGMATGISAVTRPCLRQVACVEELAALLGELSVYGVVQLLTLEPAEPCNGDHDLAVPASSEVQVYEVSSVLYGRLRRTVSQIDVNRPEIAWNIMCKCAPDTVCCLGAFDGWLHDMSGAQGHLRPSGRHTGPFLFSTPIRFQAGPVHVYV